MIDIARRIAAVTLAALVAGAALAPLQAEARAGGGGSFGSRGTRTFSAPPPTATAPSAAPIQRSITQPGPQIGSPAPSSQPYARPGGFFRGGGFGTGLAAGLLGAGLFGMLGGSGFFGGLGSVSSLFGLLIQIALIVLVVRFAMSWFRRRNAPQPSGAAVGAGPSGDSFDAPRDAAGESYGGSQPYGSAPQSDSPALASGDFDAFEQTLGAVQAAWSDQDLGRLRSLATPEMVQEFADDLSDHASRGVVNRVSDVKLLQGDLSEAWREGSREYATVAMRYRLVDVTVEQATGRVVEGDPNSPIEATEFWTFMRSSGGRWLLSAVQQRA